MFNDARTGDHYEVTELCWEKTDENECFKTLTEDGAETGMIGCRMAMCVCEHISPIYCLRCFDAVGWAAGRASGL